MDMDAISGCFTNYKSNEFIIYKNYYNTDIPILGGVHNIHDKIVKNLENGTNLSKYNELDAILLTQFFKEYKNIANQQSLSSSVITNILDSNNITLPYIDFSISGTKFENELYKLVDKTWTNNSKTLGGQSATVFLKIGQNLSENKEDYLKKMLGEAYSEIIEDFSKAVQDEIIKESQDGNLYIKIKTARSGKIDVQGTGSQNVNITGIPNQNMLKVINMLGNATFSVKSYQSKSSIHLGSTVGEKAVAAMAEFTGTEWARGSALFYLKHPKIINSLYKNPKEKIEIEDIYNHYNHMKKIYELSGLGLTYDDITQLTNVDFLLVNRTKGDINVYSVKYLINTFLKTGKFLYTI